MRFDAIIACLSGTGLAVGRALGRRGLRVAGVDPRWWEIGHRSRYIHGSAELSVRAVRALAADDRPVLFACGDPELMWVLENAAALNGVVRLPAAYTNGIAAGVVDKRRYYARCLDLGVPLPRTWFPRDADDVARAAEQARFPVLVKPPPGYGKPQECPDAHALSLAARPAGGVVIQELIDGPVQDLWVFAAHRDTAGNVGPSVTGRKLRQFPVDYGSACRLITEADAEVDRRSRALLDALDLTGPCGVEWKRSGGKLVHIEINPRPVLWYSLAEPVILDTYNALTAGPRPPALPVDDGLLWRYAIRDPGGPPPQYWCLRATDDPVPGLLAPAYTAALALKKSSTRRR